MLVMVEVTGIAPVYRRKTTQLSPRAVCFWSHNVKIANKLVVACSEKISSLCGSERPQRLLMRGLTQIIPQRIGKGVYVPSLTKRHMPILKIDELCYC